MRQMRQTQKPALPTCPQCRSSESPPAACEETEGLLSLRRAVVAAERLSEIFARFPLWVGGGFFWGGPVQHPAKAHARIFTVPPRSRWSWSPSHPPLTVSLIKQTTCGSIPVMVLMERIVLEWLQLLHLQFERRKGEHLAVPWVKPIPD